MRAGHLALLFLLMIAGCAARRSVQPLLHAQLFKVENIPASHPISAEIKLGTYNVHSLDRPDQVAADLARLSDVGAWALQEVPFTPEHRTPHAHLQSVLPPGHWYIAAVPVNSLGPSRKESESQLIVSRWPITQVEIWNLDSESPKRRVALAATLNTPDGEILFVNADLEPSFFGLGHGSRQGARSLARHLSAHRAAKVIVTGDFNTTGNLWRFASNHADVTALCQVMRTAQCEPVNRTTSTFHSGWIRLSLDHLFVRGVECQTWAVDKRATGSDHYPLWCELRPASELPSVANNSEVRTAIRGPSVPGGGRLAGRLQGAGDIAALDRLHHD